MSSASAGRDRSMHWSFDMGTSLNRIVQTRRTLSHPQGGNQRDHGRRMPGSAWLEWPECRVMMMADDTLEPPGRRCRVLFTRKLVCSFCGRTAAQVSRLAAGRKAYICDACAAEAHRIMSDPCSAPDRSSTRPVGSPDGDVRRGERS